MSNKIVAVFGGTGGTGKAVVAAALEEGYPVQALVRTPSKMTIKDDRLTLIEGDFSSQDAIRQTIKGATYVVCVAGGKPKPDGDKEINKDLMQKFIKLLWPLLEQESSVEYFLYQAGGLCPKPDGTNALIMKLVRPIAGYLAGITEMIEDNAQVMKFIDEHAAAGTKFHAIVIRPGVLKDIPGGTQLKASDRPPSGPTSYEDLGKFIVLKGMKDESQVGRYPFVSPAPTAPTSG